MGSLCGWVQGEEEGLELNRHNHPLISSPPNSPLGTPLQNLTMNPFYSWINWSSEKGNYTEAKLWLECKYLNSMVQIACILLLNTLQGLHVLKQLGILQPSECKGQSGEIWEAGTYSGCLIHLFIQQIFNEYLTHVKHLEILQWSLHSSGKDALKSLSKYILCQVEITAMEKNKRERWWRSGGYFK